MTWGDRGWTCKVSFGYDGDGRRLWKREYLPRPLGVVVRLTLYVGYGFEEGYVEELVPHEAGEMVVPGDVCGKGLVQQDKVVGVTERGFTGQRQEISFGLYDYNARYLSPGLGRFVSPDSIVPDPSNPQSFNRYSYVRNNPLRYIDPTGHCEFDAEGRISRFDCSLDEFDQISIEDRLYWMEQFMRQVPQSKDWFNNIVGIIEAFVENGKGDPGTWISVVDAGILQGIQDGYAQSEGLTNLPSVNPGAKEWRNFFDTLFTERDQTDLLISLWGTAEAAATGYGVDVAAGMGLSPNGYERIFLNTGNLYRFAASSFEGGLGTPVSWIGAGLSFSVDILLWPPGGSAGLTGYRVGYATGKFFNDPRSTFLGHSPVYWYTSAIWNLAGN